MYNKKNVCIYIYIYIYINIFFINILVLRLSPQTKIPGPAADLFFGFYFQLFLYGL